MLGGGGAQQLDRLAIEENDRAEVDRELQVDALCLVLAGGRADADAGVVDERRAATVRAWPSSPRMWAMPRPIPLEAPVTMAARFGMARNLPWEA